MKNNELPPIALHFAAFLNDAEKDERIKKGLCPECGEKLIYESGCAICPGCGWSACDN